MIGGSGTEQTATAFPFSSQQSHSIYVRPLGNHSTTARLLFERIHAPSYNRLSGLLPCVAATAYPDAST